MMILDSSLLFWATL